MTSHTTPCRRRKPPGARCEFVDALELLGAASAREGEVVEARRLDADAQQGRAQIDYRWRRPHIETLRQEALAL